MAKTTPTSDDEIDLIELIQVFLTHKIKFIILGIVGLGLGLAYTFQHEPRFETDFKVNVGHPAFNNDFLINSAGVQEMLNTSELNKKILPNYSFNKKTQLFNVMTKTEDLSQEVADLFNEALRQELGDLKKTAGSFEGFDDKSIILNNNNYGSNLTWTNKDIAKLNPEQVAQSIKVSFSEPEVVYPKPIKHGVIGIFVGLVLAFLWMIADILMRQLKKK
ncbi:Wzz/FepE/Etk N-terminal domain-containing protein [Methylophilaceae bacterium]|nr:Wzz/FepE/Etk N-terminal domain-containing protein [Methylophilaceae bacterium]